MIIISAMSENRVIGSGRGMPWHVPAEYDQYLRFVNGNCVIMGRTTYEIFGADLSETTSIVVVSRSASIANAIVARSFDEAVMIANKSDKRVFVAGGSSIYSLAIDVASEMYLSTIKGEFEGDSYFPAIDLDAWGIVEEKDQGEFKQIAV